MRRLLPLCLLLALLMGLTGCYQPGFTIDNGEATVTNLDFNFGPSYDGFSVTISPEKQAKTLQKLGLDVPEDIAAEGAEEYPYLIQLQAMGWGEYDFDTYEWTPTSNQVFSFDCEVFDVENMYPLFLQGLQAISADELEFTDAAQDNSAVDWESGEGTIAVSYRLNDTLYESEYASMYDWLDTGILSNVNDALAQQKIEKRFYSMYDGGQGVIVFYCDGKWADSFKNATGYALSTTGT